MKRNYIKSCPNYLFTCKISSAFGNTKNFQKTGNSLLHRVTWSPTAFSTAFWDDEKAKWKIVKKSKIIDGLGKQFDVFWSLKMLWSNFSIYRQSINWDVVWSRFTWNRLQNLQLFGLQLLCLISCLLRPSRRHSYYNQILIWKT